MGVSVNGDSLLSLSKTCPLAVNHFAINGDTLFELASASKPLTAALVVQLAEDGLLQLDDAAVKWLPQLPPVWGAMTIRHLLNQTAGIPDYMSQINSTKLLGLDGLTNDKLFQRWTTSNRLNFVPGT